MQPSPSSLSNMDWSEFADRGSNSSVRMDRKTETMAGVATTCFLRRGEHHRGYAFDLGWRLSPLATRFRPRRRPAVPQTGLSQNPLLGCQSRRLSEAALMPVPARRGSRPSPSCTSRAGRRPTTKRQSAARRNGFPARQQHLPSAQFALKQRAFDNGPWAC